MKKNDLVYADFFHRCLEKRNRKRNSFVIMSSKNNNYVACCKDFIEISLKYQTLDSIKHKLVLEWFYSSGLNWDEDYLSSCVNMIFDNKKTDSFSFCFQIIILDGVSSELHAVTADMFFYF